MANKTNPEFEAAKSRIAATMDEIGHLVSEISGTFDPNEVENVIPENEKSSFILSQSSLIDAYRNRDECDPRDAYWKRRCCLTPCDGEDCPLWAKYV